MLSAFVLAVSASSPSPASAQFVDSPRLRFGIGGELGGFAGAAHGALGGIALRLGVQFNELIAIYWQSQGLLGRFLPAPGDGLAGFSFNTAMLDFTVGNIVQLGIGPSLDFVWGCSEEHQNACSSSGAYLGGDARIAVVLGGAGPGRRTGLALSLDIHPTWFGDRYAAVAFLLGASYEMY